MGGVQPALARNAFGLRHAVSVLLESRGMDLGRLHFERRVHSHVVALSSLLHSAAEHASALRALQAEAGEAPRRQACDGELVIEAATTSMQRDLLMIDAVTGADRAVTVDWESALALRPVATRRRPCGYWLDATATEAVLRLRGLGVQVRRLEAATSLQVQRYRETARGGPVEAPRPLRLTVTLDGQRQWDAPAGGHYVPMDQPLAALAAAALEPDTAHSYVAHRLLTLDQLARVTQAP